MTRSLGRGERKAARAQHLGQADENQPLAGSWHGAAVDAEPWLRAAPADVNGKLTRGCAGS